MKSTTDRRPMVFLIHSAEDAEMATRLLFLLRADFLSSVEFVSSSAIASISSGEAWIEHIRDAIERSAGVMVFISQETIQRPWIHFWAGAAYTLGKAAVPICQSIDLSDLPLPLGSLRAVRVDTTQGLTRLYDWLAGILGLEAAPAVQTIATRLREAGLLTGSEDPASALTIFVCYRRSDSADTTGRIHDRLIQRFGKHNVFKDVDSLPLGVDFREHIDAVLQRCDSFIAVIGNQWLGAELHGARRLDDPRDHVRIEISRALGRGIPVVPVLLGTATIPSEQELPEELAALAYRHGITVRPDPDFHHDIDRLIAGLEANILK